MEPFEQQLSADLAGLRPTPRPTFAAELDERAAAGFPRSPKKSEPFAGLLAWLRSLSPRRLAFSSAGVALAAIAIATVVVGVQEQQTGADPSSGSGLLSEFTPIDAADSQAPVPSASAPERAAGAAAGGTSLPLVPTDRGGFAAKAGHREIERSAEIVLGSDPAEVGADAAKVFDVVHAHRGIVLNSSTSEGEAGVAAARFELLIPSAKLGDAMADFSQIAEVRSRHEATADITAPTIGVGERLRDSRARIDGLLAQLASADTDSEREAVETELRGERRHAAALRSRLSNLQRRANLSRVSLRIESGAGTSSADSDQGWGVDDALGDAGHILGIAAGVAVIGLAILAPIALVALLAWLAGRAWTRRGRERTLD